MSDYEEEWQDLSEKEIMIGVLTELQQIRLLLQETETDRDASEQMFECKRCGEHVTSADKHTHATNGHNAHSGMVDQMFSPVIE